MLTLLTLTPPQVTDREGESEWGGPQKTRAAGGRTSLLPPSREQFLPAKDWRADKKRAVFCVDPEASLGPFTSVKWQYEMYWEGVKTWGVFGDSDSEILERAFRNHEEQTLLKIDTGFGKDTEYLVEIWKNCAKMRQVNVKTGAWWCVRAVFQLPLVSIQNTHHYMHCSYLN